MDYRRHLGERRFLHLLTVPFIYVVIIPIVLLDLIMEIYHHISFPLYGIPLVVRSQYVRVDRHKLQYLTWYDKFNCAYCGYVNGMLRYACRIAQESERYWCGIMHEKRGNLIAPEHQKDFLPYGDEAAFQKYVADISHKDHFGTDQESK